MTDEKYLSIRDVEKVRVVREAQHRATTEAVIYWVGDEDEPRQFGVTFDGHVTNIAKQGVVESIILALTVFEDMIESLEKKADA